MRLARPTFWSTTRPGRSGAIWRARRLPIGRRKCRSTSTASSCARRRCCPAWSRAARAPSSTSARSTGLMALGNPAYSAAKAGLLSLTRSLAVEYGPKGIRTNMVSPGTVETDIENWRIRRRKNPQIFDQLARWYPVGRVGQPEDIAAAVAFVAGRRGGLRQRRQPRGRRRPHRRPPGNDRGADPRIGAAPHGAHASDEPFAVVRGYSLP